MPRRKNGVNKSQLIREIYSQQPKIKVKEIVSQLGAKGIKVEPSLVYYIKARIKRARRKKIGQQAAQNMGAANPVELIRKVKSLSADVGGIGKLKQLIDMLAE